MTDYLDDDEPTPGGLTRRELREDRERCIFLLTLHAMMQCRDRAQRRAKARRESPQDGSERLESL